jgi:hypothetical protein
MELEEMAELLALLQYLAHQFLMLVVAVAEVVTSVQLEAAQVVQTLVMAELME